MGARGVGLRRTFTSTATSAAAAVLRPRSSSAATARERQREERDPRRGDETLTHRDAAQCTLKRVEAQVVDGAVTAPDVADFGRKLSPSAPKSRCLKHLHARLSEARGDADLTERLACIEKLARWVCDGPKPPPPEEGSPVEPAPTTRLRLLIRALDEAPAFRTELATVVRTVIAESNALPLLCETGLPNPRGMGTETADRIARRLLPTPSEPRDLSELLARMFKTEKDAAWLAEVSGSLCGELAARLDDPLGRSAPRSRTRCACC